MKPQTHILSQTEIISLRYQEEIQFNDGYEQHEWIISEIASDEIRLHQIDQQLAKYGI